MSELKDVAKGLNILAKYKPDAIVEAHHDMICIEIYKDEFQIDNKDVLELNQLGFGIDPELDNTYTRFT